MELREKDFIDTQISATIMSKYKGRAHPEFEKRKAIETAALNNMKMTTS